MYRAGFLLLRQNWFKQLSKHFSFPSQELHQLLGKLLNIPTIILNQILGTSHNTRADVSTKSNARQNPSSCHNNRATRETNLQN